MFLVPTITRKLTRKTSLNKEFLVNLNKEFLVNAEQGISLQVGNKENFLVEKLTRTPC